MCVQYNHDIYSQYFYFVVEKNRLILIELRNEKWPIINKHKDRISAEKRFASHH